MEQPAAGESTDHHAMKDEESTITDSVYATPAANIQRVVFEHKIPTINPVSKHELINYVTNKEIKAFQQEFRVSTIIIII